MSMSFTVLSQLFLDIPHPSLCAGKLAFYKVLESLHSGTLFLRFVFTALENLRLNCIDFNFCLAVCFLFVYVFTYLTLHIATY